MFKRESSRSAIASAKTFVVDSSASRRRIRNALLSITPSAKAVFALSMALVVAAAISHFVAGWLGLPEPAVTYRRIGPKNGAQVFCAGSSVVQFGLSWPEISEALGQGIENWGLGGSTPSEWEVSQGLPANTNLMILGLSLHDLNEYFVCDSRANVVSPGQTIEDLWQSKPDWQFTRRIFGQYPLAYLRVLFPTAAKSDAVLVGLRRKVRELIGSPPSADDKANFLVLPSEPVLNFGDSAAKLSDWPTDKALRRLDALRQEIHGSHWFEGPKHLAFLRMLHRAQEKGHVIVVVVPVAPMYAHEFLTPQVLHNFESALAEAHRTVPGALFVRLDRLPSLQSDEYFSDFVHLNGAGKQIATQAFLQQIPKEYRSP